MTAREQLERLAQTMPESEAEAYLALPEILAAQEELLTAAEAAVTALWLLIVLLPNSLVRKDAVAKHDALVAAVARARGEAPPAKETT